jgi:AcrR family transcriptional regulator
MHQPRAQAKREQILAAAQPLFLAQGFERTTMDAITAAAGVSKQTLYHYYPSKEQLFAHVLQALALHRVWVDVPEAKLAAAVASRADLERVLCEIAQSLVKYLTDPSYLALVRVVIAELPRFPHLAEAFWSAVPMRGQTVFTALLQQAGARGLLNVSRFDLAIRLFVGSLLTYVLGRMFGTREEGSEPPQEELAQLVHMFMRAIT